METLTDALPALALLALAWWILSRVSRTYSAEWQRIRDAHATHDDARRMTRTHRAHHTHDTQHDAPHRTAPCGGWSCRESAA